MKKKNIQNLLFASLALMIMLTFSTAYAGPSPTPKGWPKYLSITAPSVGSVLYIVDAGIAGMVKKHLGIDAGAVSLGLSEAALRAIGKGEAELGFIGVMEAMQAVRGVDKFKGNKIQARQLFASYPLFFPVWARKDSGITKFEDLRGKRVMWKSPNSAIIRETARSLFECYGFDPEKDTVPLPMGSQKDVADALRSRTADAFTFIESADSPVAVWSELADTIDIVPIPLDREKIACVIEKKPYIFQGRMKGGIYKGMKDDVPALGLAQPMIAMKSLPEDLVYEIMKLVFDPANRAEFEAIHPAAKDIRKDSAMMYTNVPFHAGAVRFYKEKGWWKIEDVHNKLLKELGQDK